MCLSRATVLVLLCFGLRAADGIHLKSRSIDGRLESPGPVARHILVQFRHYPDANLRAELVRRGCRILNYLPDTSLSLEVPGGADLRRLPIVWMGSLRPADKLSRALEERPSAWYLVEFHPGTSGEAARAIAGQHGFVIEEVLGLVPGHLVVSGAYAKLRALAEHEEVAYILPADPGLLRGRRVAGCPGPITEAGPLADYVLADSGWPRDAQGHVALQYLFDSMTGKLDANVARSQVERAFAEWARYSGLSFSPAVQGGGSRTIDILFATGAHGDAYPFTSITTLAHTFYPSPPNPEPIAGDLHFNDAQTWGVQMNIDLFSVALHEIGHALGLGHSDIPGAVMYPYYKLVAGLSNDDIAAVQALYGAPSSAAGAPSQPSQPSTPAPPPTSPPPPGGDTVPPALAITTPSYSIVSTTASTITIAGTSADNVAVTSVKWSTAFGSSGTASGTASWTATVPLLIGTNSITIRAYDAAGNSAWRSLTVVRN